MNGIESDHGAGGGRLALLYTVSDGRPIWGVASLDDQLFVVRERSTGVDVYRYTTLRRRLEVPGLTAGRDLAACPRHACLYITDVGCASKAQPTTTTTTHRYAIHRSRNSLPVLYIFVIIIHKLFHRRTRASYVCNECLAWYNVVLTHGSTQA